MEEILAIYQC